MTGMINEIIKMLLWYIDPNDILITYKKKSILMY